MPLTSRASSRCQFRLSFSTLVKELLPMGFKGLVVGGILAALMSSLASLFNSSATLFTIDFYQKYRPNAPEAELVRLEE
jgi:solute:Na+ symporter, SSS family